jgi:ABC-type nitrate/sulfonate/bicarbonate transport system permease component
MVVSELVGNSNGIGYQMNSASGDYDLTGLWAGIVLLGILGYVLNAAASARAPRAGGLAPRLTS